MLGLFLHARALPLDRIGIVVGPLIVIFWYSFVFVCSCFVSGRPRAASEEQGRRATPPGYHAPVLQVQRAKLEPRVFARRCALLSGTASGAAEGGRAPRDVGEFPPILYPLPPPRYRVRWIRKGYSCVRKKRTLRLDGIPGVDGELLGYMLLLLYLQMFGI